MTAKELSERTGISYEAAKKRLQRDKKGQGIRNVPEMSPSAVPALSPDVPSETSNEVLHAEICQLSAEVEELRCRVVALESQLASDEAKEPQPVTLANYSGSAKSVDVNFNWGL